MYQTPFMNFSVLKYTNILIHLKNSKENVLSLVYKFYTAGSIVLQSE